LTTHTFPDESLHRNRQLYSVKDQETAKRLAVEDELVLHNQENQSKQNHLLEELSQVERNAVSRIHELEMNLSVAHMTAQEWEEKFKNEVLTQENSRQTLAQKIEELMSEKRLLSREVNENRGKLQEFFQVCSVD
jgi:hypothetical protein